MKTRIDSSAHNHLAACECGWRGLPAIDPADAYQQATHHETRAHPTDWHARDLAKKHQRRHR